MLKKGANVILLDEPTNDLDVDTLRSLEEGISNYPGCVLVTSHDRWFLDRLATHILAYEDEGHVEWFEGNFEDYEKDKIRRLGEEACRPHRVRYKNLNAEAKMKSRNNFPAFYCLLLNRRQILLGTELSEITS